MAPDKDKARHGQHTRPRRRKPQRSGGHCDPAAAAAPAPNAFAAHASLKDFPDSFGEALHGGGALLGGKLQRSFSGLQQRVKAARESSVETRQRALALLASVIQKHLDGTPAGNWYRRVTSRRHSSADKGLVRGAGSRRESRAFAGGTLAFGALLWLAGAAPWSLPAVYLAFAAVAVPYRAVEFGTGRNAFFLLDFCYWVNLATVALLVFAPGNLQLEAAVYALADGPLAAALIVWQSAWVFGSPSHGISVLIHALPGMALLAHRRCPVPPTVLAAVSRFSPAAAAWAGARTAAVEGSRAMTESSFWWTAAAPLAFYGAWQLVYWLVVQVMCRRFILSRGYDTSYRCLARRAAKTNNWLNRFVRRGSAMRRVCAYGGLQLAYSVAALLVFQGLSRSFWTQLAWQIVKIAVPVYCGAKHQCERLPRAAVALAIKQYQEQAAAAEAAAQVYEMSADARAADVTGRKRAPAAAAY